MHYGKFPGLEINKYKFRMKNQYTLAHLCEILLLDLKFVYFFIIISHVPFTNLDKVGFVDFFFCLFEDIVQNSNFPCTE